MMALKDFNDPDYNFSTTTKILILIVTAVLWMTILTFFLSTKSFAHDWYPIVCCSDKDCKEDTEKLVEELPNGDVEVKGFGTFQKGDPKIKQGRDENNHLCLRLNWKTSSDGMIAERPTTGDKDTVICIFLPAKGS